MNFRRLLADEHSCENEAKIDSEHIAKGKNGGGEVPFTGAIPPIYNIHRSWEHENLASSQKEEAEDSGSEIVFSQIFDPSSSHVHPGADNQTNVQFLAKRDHPNQSECEVAAVINVGEPNDWVLRSVIKISCLLHYRTKLNESSRVRKSKQAKRNHLKPPHRRKQDRLLFLVFIKHISNLALLKDF